MPAPSATDPQPTMPRLADLADDIRQAHAGIAWRSENHTRKLKRARRLVGDRLGANETVEAVDDTLERVLANSDLVAVSWLSTGQRRSSAVARIDVPAGTGTGFLVSPWLVMTNHHVIPDPTVAQASECRFGYQEEADGSVPPVTRVDCDPDRFFCTDPELDYTLVAVQAINGQPPGQALGVIPLMGSVGKILVGEPVNIVQHPQGRPKEIAFRNNLLIRINDEDTVTYQTDTDSGSSGSPVFNDQWELIALHRRGVEATNADGRKIDRFGRPVTHATPDHLRHWMANEGVRVSAIVRHITAGTYRGEKRVLVDELLELGGTR